jgi:2',3'-cyclic-nucleotide 2'-phosphodiesterase (5'-nucleotidase family)
MLLTRIASGRRTRFWVVSFCISIGCSPSPRAPAEAPGAAATADRSPRKPRLELTVLATAHEGELLPAGDGSGGAARALGYWRAREQHCAANVGCDTLVLSAGDHWQEGALATRFRGEPVAQAMRLMGYAASARGASDLLFGVKAFHRNLELAGVPHLGTPGDSEPEKPLLIDKQGVKIELIGLAKSAGADAGTVADLFSALDGRAQAIVEHGAHVGILLSNACVDELTAVLKRGAREWPFLVLAIGQACGAHAVESPIYGTALIAAGTGFRQYGRARLTFDRNTGALLRAETGSVEVAAGPDAPVPDAALSATLAAWSNRL